MPLAGRGYAGRLILSLLSTFILISTSRVVSDVRRHRLWAILLVIPPLLLQWISTNFELATDRIYMVPSLYHLPIYLFIGFLMVSYLFKGDQLRLDHLFGAISFYLLIGLFWTHLYLSLIHI